MIGLLGSMLGGRGGRMIGGMIGGRHGAMLGGLAGAMLGGRQLRSLGGLLGGLRGGGDDEPEAMPAAPAPSMSDADAEVLVRAMCNAAKADGQIDEEEAEKIESELADASSDERIFLRRELRTPAISASAMAASVPEGLAAETYAVSLISITVDTMAEATYLRDLRDALGLSHADVDDIHDQLDVPHL